MDKEENQYTLKSLHKSLLKQDKKFQENWDVFVSFMDEKEFWKNHDFEFNDLNLNELKVKYIENQEIETFVTLLDEYINQTYKKNKNEFKDINYSSDELNFVLEELNCLENNDYIEDDKFINENNKEETTIITIENKKIK
ncbi:hypothetical protein [Mycoplasma sp. 1018B]|uniref:hypothetical protein n=1 Tax=Mycoplasma sp. 1018B TaxID=2967302 RepID=UPI00211CDD5C|nr:hypothetical protein [Mycoplasma sp. 1018B]UUM19293.1 hypothetical protein NPA14_00225 [Mycoplasma sp. 1018B]